MKTTATTLIAIAILLCTTNPMLAQKKTPKERIVIEVIHDHNVGERIALTRDSIAREIGVDDNQQRFLLGTAVMLGNIAYSMITGSVVEGGQNYLKRQLARSKEKYTSEWTASVSKDYFYKNISLNGALDPSDMQFGGIRTLRLAPNKITPNVMDTAFYFSARVSNVPDIIKTSRFTLALDTLIIDLSRTRAVLPKGKKFSLDVQTKFLASWVNQATQYFKDQELGIFNITLKDVIYDPEKPIYLITGSSPAGQLAGSSFVIPRSAYGIVMGDGSYRTCFGQGEYSLVVTIKEATTHKAVMRDFFNDYVIKVADVYGNAIKSSKIIESGVDIQLPGTGAPAAASPTPPKK